MKNKPHSAVPTRQAAVIAVVRGCAFALVTLLYLSVPAPLSSYLWAVYVGFFLTMALGCKAGRLPSYLLSLGCGFLWGFLYMHLSGWLFVLIPALGTTICTVLAEFILTASLLFIHLRFFSGTLIGTVPAIFAAVAMIFASGSLSAVPWCALSAGIGICMAFLTDRIISLILSKAAKPKP